MIKTNSKTQQKKAKVKVGYYKLTPGMSTLTDGQIYPGNTIGILPTKSAAVGDLVAIWKPKTGRWRRGVWQGQSRGQLMVNDESDNATILCYYPLDEWALYGRIVEVDAFFDVEYLDEIPIGTTNKSGVAESDLVM